MLLSTSPVFCENLMKTIGLANARDFAFVYHKGDSQYMVVSQTPDNGEITHSLDKYLSAA